MKKSSVFGVLLMTASFSFVLNAHASDKYVFKKHLGEWSASKTQDQSGGGGTEDEAIVSTNAFEAYINNDYWSTNFQNMLGGLLEYSDPGTILFERNSNIQNLAHLVNIRNKSDKPEILKYSTDLGGVPAGFLNHSPYASIVPLCENNMEIAPGGTCSVVVGNEKLSYSGPDKGVIKINYDGKVFPLNFEAYIPEAHPQNLLAWSRTDSGYSYGKEITVDYNSDDLFSFQIFNLSKKSIAMDAFRDVSLTDSNGQSLYLIETNCNGSLKSIVRNTEEIANCRVNFGVDFNALNFGVHVFPIKYGDVTINARAVKGLELEFNTMREGVYLSKEVKAGNNYEVTFPAVKRNNQNELWSSFNFYNSSPRSLVFSSGQGGTKIITADDGFFIDDRCQQDQISRYSGCSIHAKITPSEVTGNLATLRIQFAGGTYIAHQPIED